MFTRRVTKELSHRIYITVLLFLFTQANANEEIAVTDFTTASATISPISENSEDLSDNDRTFRAVPLKFLSDNYGMNSYHPLRLSSRHNEGYQHYDPSNPSSILTNAQPLMFSTRPNTGPNKAPIRDTGCFFGINCITDNKLDDWKTYYSVLNGLDKSNTYGNGKFNHRLGFNSENNLPTNEYAFTSIPFAVSGHPYKTTVAKNDFRSDSYRQENPRFELNRYYNSLYPHKMSKTTPSSDPNWVKLEAILPEKYDPFSISANKSSESNSTQYNRTNFSNRVGEIISPESFADRYGWKEDKLGGSRLPSWLEELTYPRYPNPNEHEQSNTNKNEYGNKGWVKLDAIPVAGVSISKWVPKGTSPSELPSTNWPAQNKPNAWWDRIDQNSGDYAIRDPLPPYLREPWPSRPQQSDPWSDVIYPSNNPISATASWQADRNKGSSGSGWSNLNYKSRYPVASWSASGNKYANSNPSLYPFETGRPLNQNRGKPSYYPDVKNQYNDPRWVLISSSKGPQKSNTHENNRRYEQAEFPYPFVNRRYSKALNLTNSSFDTVSSTSAYPLPLISHQDELFQRTNATLHSLKPFLGAKKYSEKSANTSINIPKVSQTLLDSITSTGANLIETTTKKFFGNILSSEVNQNQKKSNNSPSVKNENKNRNLFNGINPVYAAVGAGMLPASFGAILPVLLGRKKRTLNDREFNKFRQSALENKNYSLSSLNKFSNVKLKL